MRDAADEIERLTAAIEATGYAELLEAAKRGEELQRTFDLQWAADQRAIKRWQEANPGNELVWPDRADMVVWLMDRLSDFQAACVAMVEAEDALLAELRAEGVHPDLTVKPWLLVDAMRHAIAALSKPTGSNQ